MTSALQVEKTESSHYLAYLVVFGDLGASSARSAPAQLEALDLAGGGLGQLGHELDPARVLERSERGLDEGLELAGEGVAVAAARIAQHDERLGLGQAVGVLGADHGGLEDRGVGGERGLDLER